MQDNYTTFLTGLYKLGQQVETQNKEKWQSRLVRDRLLQQLTERSKNVFFVQVGACDGVLHDPIRPFILKHGWHGILVEPLPDLFEQLKKNYCHNDGLVFENAAIAESAGHKQLHRVDPEVLHQYPEWAAGCATFIENSKNIASKPELKQHLITETVRTMSLEELLDKHQVKNIDILQIDTEGYDYKVLRQLDFTRFKPLVINMEYVHLTDEEKMSTCALLNEQGYAFRTQHLDLLAAQKTFLDTLT